MGLTTRVCTFRVRRDHEPVNTERNNGYKMVTTNSAWKSSYFTENQPVFFFGGGGGGGACPKPILRRTFGSSGTCPGGGGVNKYCGPINLGIGGDELGSRPGAKSPNVAANDGNRG
jgi:hypothetical protein